ncbi:type I methionyl aminopeptidase [Salsipaludibacter albus]|uniref:type I methionyl aminopeptidase n=1 Tax=Salsipaludibacter albus TaxID=2849650 RepID=UPI001EE3E643|nr:type I methionyl aminopeptidase [Salsipaludibacter albus]
MIIKKSRREIEKMAVAGALVARAHEAVRDAVAPGVSTLELDRIAEKVITGDGGIPSFKGYGGRHGSIPPFPGTLCTSVNDQIVHGIPSESVVLEEGDLVKLDCGAIVDGYHGDSAATWIVGGEEAVDPQVADLVRTTRAGMWAGIRSLQVGNRLGDIGSAIEAEANARGYGIVREYVGHGIGRSLHEDPSVPNYGTAGRGAKLSKGWVLAIEPMFNLGGDDTRTLDDHWTVVTADGELSSHWEHTVALTADGPRVLTARSDEPTWPLEESTPA